MPDRTDLPQRVSIGDAARILGVSVDTMRRWDKTGELPAVRTAGKQRRYLVSDIDAFLAQHTRNAS